MFRRRSIDEAKKGSAEILILALIEERSLHGYEIARRIEERGWIRGRWVEKAGQRRRCHYRITEAGRRVLTTQRQDWARFVAALGKVAGVPYA